MNSRERKVMTEVKVMMAEVRTDIKWIRKNVDEHNNKLDKIKDKLVKIETGFKNHLKHHESDLKKLGIAVTIIGIITSAIITILLKVLLS